VPFGYDKSANEGTVKFLAKFGAIAPISPEIGGARQRIQSRDIKITPYLQLTVTYSPVCYVTQYSFVQNFRRFGKLYIFGNLRTY